MVVSKIRSVKPLIESRDGVHLTTYLENQGDLVKICGQLRRSIEYAYENLAPVMPPIQSTRFLEPLDKLVANPLVLANMAGNIGIFRSFESFRILNVPVHVKAGTHVASSFHVKPLIKWLQTDQEFLLLAFTKISDRQFEASVYWGNRTSFRQVAVTLLPLQNKAGSLEFDSSWVHEVFASQEEYGGIKVFLCGDTALCERAKPDLQLENIDERFIGVSGDKYNLEQLCREIRVSMMLHARRKLESTLNEFVFADLENRTSKNLFLIAKAVVKGRVRKLIVSDEVQIFGKIDRKSGGLAIHPFDLDHEDDDLLDDLAQMVLSQGGEVFVASRDEIPNGRPILAILDEDGKGLLKLENVSHFEVPRERWG